MFTSTYQISQTACHKLPDLEAGCSGVSMVTWVPLTPGAYGAMPRVLMGAVPGALRNFLGDSP